MERKSRVFSVITISYEYGIGALHNPASECIHSSADIFISFHYLH